MKGSTSGFARLLAGLVVCAAGCGETALAGDSESHFLTACPGDCGDLSCVCGVCTKECEADSACGALSSKAKATCGELTPSRCGGEEPEVAKACTVECSTSTECNRLRTGYECVSGQCRPESEGAGGGGGEGSGPNDGGAGGGGAGSGGGGNDECCLDQALQWRLIFSSPLVVHAGGIAACDTFNWAFGYNSTCQSHLPACGTGWEIDAQDVNRALANPDVVAALAAAPVQYGRLGSSEPQGLAISGPTGDVIVGYDCADEADCTPIPEGVLALVEILNTLTTQQGSGATCFLSDPCSPSPFEPKEGADCGAQIDDECFESTARACLCACSRSGESFEQCAATDGDPPQVECSAD